MYCTMYTLFVSIKATLINGKNTMSVNKFLNKYNLIAVNKQNKQKNPPQCYICK